MKEIKLYKSRWRAIKLLLLSSIFVIGGIWLITSTDDSKWVGWMSIIFFGLGLPIALFHLFDRRPQIVINEIGIYDRTTKLDFINWELIEDAYLTDVNGQKFISLIIDEKYEPSKTKGKKFQRTAKLNKAFGFQEVNISLGQIKIDEMKLMEFIMAMSGADNTQRKGLIKTLS